MKSRFFWSLSLVILVFLDQSSKWAAIEYLHYGIPVELLPIFDLTLLHNTGAAFSLFADLGWQRWFLVAVSLIASVVLFYLLFFGRQSNALQSTAIMLILAGAFGNLIDRLLLGHVIDFISLHYAGFYFPTFNVADACISIGALLWIIESIRFRKHS